jgi:8-oxo-dGTP pyrophosphatase MutT (NUDIX family)
MNKKYPLLMLKRTRKPLKYAVSFTLYNPSNKNEFLIIKRPADDNEHPNLWGFPATMLKPGELPENCLRRAAKEKLGVDIEPFEFTGAIAQERNEFILYLMHFKAILNKGNPDLKKSITLGTKYAELEWTDDPKRLLPIAEKGSICVQLFLHSIGMWPRQKFIYKLEM